MASDSTVWRLLDQLEPPELTAIAAAPAAAGIAVLSLRTLLQLMFLPLNTRTFVWARQLYPTPLRAFGTGTAVTVLLLSASFVPLPAGVVKDADESRGVRRLVPGPRDARILVGGAQRAHAA